MIKDIMNHNADAAAGLKELETLRKYFPQCFHSDGEFDIEAFKAALPGGTTITDETSGFNWLGKNYARMLTNEHLLCDLFCLAAQSRALGNV